MSPRSLRYILRHRGRAVTSRSLQLLLWCHSVKCKTDTFGCVIKNRGKGAQTNRSIPGRNGLLQNECPILNNNGAMIINVGKGSPHVI